MKRDELIYKRDFHLFNTDGCNFLFIIDDLRVYEVDKIIPDILMLKFPITKELIIKNLKVKYPLVLIRSTIGELFKENIISGNIYNSHKEKDIPKRCFNGFNGVFICVSETCNLRCKYCCADYGQHGQGPKLMTKQEAKEILDFIKRNHANQNIPTKIYFIGGEPFLNFEVIKFVVHYSKHLFKRPSFGLNTNGTIVNKEILNFILKEKINVVFSLDGPKQIQNKNRPFVNGKDSFNKVFGNIKKSQKKLKRSTRIQTVIREDEDLCKIFSFFRENYFYDIIAVPEYKSPFMTNNDNYNSSLFEKHLEEYKRCNRLYLKSLMSNECATCLSITREMLNLLRIRQIRGPGCGVGRIPAITSSGDIYGCQSLVGIKEGYLGNIKRGISHKKTNRFFNKINYLYSKCESCWARTICNGACIALSLIYNWLDSLDEPSERCPLFRKYIEDCIYIYSKARTFTERS